MQITRFIILSVSCYLSLSSCNTKPAIDTDPVHDLISRIMKDKANQFSIEYIEQVNGKDVFELDSKDDKIVLRGNNGVAIASALNHYLKIYLNCHISWSGTQLNFPEHLPKIARSIRKISPYKYRYYLNYCTFNYTMAWWDWDRWQSEIDWMALNGINMPLALTGEEAIWRDVYREMGFTDKELESLFSGPAYFSWLWMGNIDGWGGPLPQHWMDTHKALEKNILKKERALGMTPVLPAFTGHVPPSFVNRFPNAKLRKTNWGAGFSDVFILDPEDSLFERVGKAFLDKQTVEYGTDHLYSADTFNENVPPSNDSTFLSRITEKIFRSMSNVDPQATWIMQGWMFHYNADFWKPAQMKALFAAVPDDRMIILDLYSESHPVWKETDAYFGKPWIWNMLQNFGGNVALFGRMENVANDPADALNDPSSGKMTGIGLTPEGIEQNPALFELMLENTWQRETINLDEWLKAYANRRYGAENQAIHNAWAILKSTVYSGGLTEGGQESIIVARPTFSVQGHRVLTKLNYDPLELAKAWEIFISQADQLCKSEGFQYDLVDITRQVLANYASSLQQEIALAYKNNNKKKFETYTQAFLELIDDMDTLLATRNEFLLGKWISDARKWGATEEEKDLYEFNARDLVTLWGDKDSELHEYSNRQWSGLLKGFYKPRWEKFFDYVSVSMNNQSALDLMAFEESLKEWEWQWVNQTDLPYPSHPKGDPVEISKQLFNKYQSRIFNHINP